MAACLILCMLNCGCTSVREYLQNGFEVGPNYGRPPAPVAPDWIDAADVRVRKDAEDLSRWWTVFNDPVLNTLVETAYVQNPSLRAAGVRVLEAQAQRGIAIGELFPQQQDSFGTYSRNDLSENKANRNTPGLKTPFDDWQIGVEASWELDV